MESDHKNADGSYAEPEKASSLVERPSQSSQSEPEHQSDATAMPQMIGHFRVEQKLGTGGMSVVYKCTDLAVNRTVAVKVLQTRLLSEEKWMKRFQQEAKAIGRLSHPNIVSIHHFDVHREGPYIAMDYVEGQSLDELLQKHGPMSVERSIKLISLVMNALAHAHSNQVVHRDLKPSNIMVVNVGTAEESIKLLDFGIAKIEQASEHKLTQTGEIFGSPLYMSPEQCQGKSADHLSDQYSAGCMLYECLTGYPPFSGDNSFSILIKHINEQPPSLKEGSLGGSFEPYIEDAVRKMLEKDPHKRFASIQEAEKSLTKSTHFDQQEKQIESKSKVQRENRGNPIVIGATILGSSIFLITAVTYAMYSLKDTTPLAGKSVDLITIMDRSAKDYGDDMVLDYLSRDNNSLANKVSASAHNWKRITDKAMTKISQMPNLKRLVLTNCGDITPTGLSKLENATKLEELVLNGTPFDDTSVSTILKLKPLLYLSVNGTHIHEAGLRELAKTKLQGIDVRSINLSDAGCEAISKIKTIQMLDISENRRVTKKGLQLIADMPDLDSLDASQNSLSSSDIEALSRAKKLRMLGLSDTFVDNSGLNYINKIGTLEELWLDGTRISKGALLKLTNLNHLNRLQLSNYEPSQSERQKFDTLMPQCKIEKPKIRKAEDGL
ncbi:hypothetical protein BH10CYA1_BH10CYA1_24870 [soil metagenome]